ncbi:MAG: tetratricopeptide repeat protein [Bacteroidetes bacterium]|nr:tetratricopeptide repeat protein [Bacteroidota bacterium]
MKAIIFLVLFVLLASFDFAQNQYDAASDAIKDNNFQKALSIAQECLSKDSTDTAIKILVDLTAHDTSNKAAYEALGDAYNKMSVLELALQNYNHAEMLDSLNIPLKFKIGETLYKQKSYTDAANKFLQIITIDSNYAQAYFKVGEILYYAKQYPNAAYYLDKFLKFDQNNSKAFSYTANSLYIIHNFKHAAEVAQEGIQKFPQLTDLKKILALSLTFDKNLPEALKYLTETPDSLITGREFAQVGIEFLNGKMDSVAAIYFKKAMDKEPSLINSLAETVATTYYRSANYDSAIVYYDKKIKADSTSLSAHVNKALCMVQLQNYDGARIALLQALQIKNDYVPALQWLATSYNKLDSTEAELDTYDRLIQLASADPEKNQKLLGNTYGSKALVYLLKKKYAPAIDILKSAVKYDPDNFQYHLWLAQALALTNRKDEAIKEYRKTLQLDPKNADAKKGLKILGE